MRVLFLLISIMTLSLSIYFSLQNVESWNERHFMTIRDENSQPGDSVTGGILVKVTKDYSTLSYLLMIISIGMFSLYLFHGRVFKPRVESNENTGTQASGKNDMEQNI